MEERMPPNDVGATTSGARSAAGQPSWRQRAAPFAVARLALGRLLRHGGTLALLALGMLVADTLIGVVPLYTTLVADTQLQAALSAHGSVARNIETVVTSSHVAAATSQFAQPTVDNLTRQTIGSFIQPQRLYYLATDSLHLTQADIPFFGSFSPDQTAVPEAFDYSANPNSAAPHMRLLQGRFPRTTAPGQLPEVMITQEMADDPGVMLGGTLTLTQFTASSHRFHARVVGVWAPRNANDPYWNGLSFSVAGSPGQILPFPILMTNQTLLASFGLFTGLRLYQHWVYYLQSARLSLSSLAGDRAAITILRNRIDATLTGTHAITLTDVNTQVDQLIHTAQQQQGLAALPLYLVVAQIVGLALLFVATMTSLLIERQAGAIATLKSRGASGPQLLALFATQGAVISLLAALISPALAALASLALLHAVIPHQVFAGLGVNAGYFAQLASPQSVILPILVGALLGVGAVCLATWQAARADIVTFRRAQGRATQQPLWRRYYLDVALAALSVAGYVELGQFGSASVRLQLGENANLFLLLAPGLLLFAGALLVVRLAPFAAGLGARWAARGRGAATLLALAQVERAPRQYTRSVMLLTLAMGLSLFAFIYNASARVNTQDRIAYAVGSDLRATLVSAAIDGGGPILQHDYAQLPGVQGVTQVYRASAQTPPDQGGEAAQLLAIDPASFASVVGPTSWRADYASQSLPGLMQGMRAHQWPRAKGLAAGTAQAPLWALVSQNFAAQYQLSVGARFTLELPDQGGANIVCQVGTIVREFPTLYPEAVGAGFVVLSLGDLITAETAANVGPNEVWLRDTPALDTTTLKTIQTQAVLNAQAVISRQQELAASQNDPLTIGLEGLLLLGAALAAALAIIGGAAQTLLATTQRATQFAVLRTLGLGTRDLGRILFSEQIVVYAFGLLGGAGLGAILATATLPYLQFSDPALNTAQIATANAAQVGVPPYTLVVSWAPVALFVLTLLLTCGAAVALATRLAVARGLGQALRIGED